MANVRMASCDDFTSPCRARHRTRGKPSDRLAQARRGAPPFAPLPDFTLTAIQTICTRTSCAPSNTINLISTSAFGKLFKPSATCASAQRRDDRFSRTPLPEHRARMRRTQTLTALKLGRNCRQPPRVALVFHSAKSGHRACISPVAGCFINWA